MNIRYKRTASPTCFTSYRRSTPPNPAGLPNFDGDTVCVNAMAAAPCSNPSGSLPHVVLVLATLLSPLVQTSSAGEHVLLENLRQILNSPGVGIGARCRNHTVLYLDHLHNGTPWALKMFDSTGKPNSGVLTGGVTFLGFYSECLEALPELSQVASSTVPFSSRYCLATISLAEAQREPPKGFPAYLWTQLREESDSPRFGLCVPSSCSTDEITLLVSQLTSTFARGANASSTTCSPHRETFASNSAAIGVA